MLKSLLVCTVTAAIAGGVCKLLWGFFWQGVFWAVFVFVILQLVWMLADVIEEWLASWRRPS